MAEGLAAEQVVALQVAAYRFQEAQHKGGAGGRRQLDHADPPVRSHWEQHGRLICKIIF